MLRAISTIVVWSLAPATPAYADLTPCEAYGRADIVFVGEARAPVSRLVVPGDQAPFSINVSPVIIERTFRGPAIEVAYITPAGIMEYLEPGRRYLVYGRRYHGRDMFMSSPQYGSKLFDLATEDLRFFEIVTTNNAGNTVSGVLEEEAFDARHEASRHHPIPNVDVRIFNGAYATQARTDSLGRFAASGLPDGIYSIDPSLPPELIAHVDTERQVTVSGGGCASSRIRAFVNGRVQGTLRGPDGAPLPMKTVGLVPQDVPAGASGHIRGEASAETDDKGRFQFVAVAPGRYWLGVNLSSGPSPSAPYPRTYYPGTAAQESAIPIVLERAALVDGLDFSLGSALREGSVRVSVDAQDRRGELSVCFENLDDRVKSWSRVFLPARQPITFPALEGVRYEVHAHLEFPGGHLESAPIAFTGTSGALVFKLVPDTPRNIHR